MTAEQLYSRHAAYLADPALAPPESTAWPIARLASCTQYPVSPGCTSRLQIREQDRLCL